MKFHFALLMMIAVVGLSACNKAEVVYVPAGEAAPAFASTPETQTLQGFIVGRWAVFTKSDPNMSKALGLPADFGAEMSASNPSDGEHRFQFNADGTFKSRIKKDGAVIAGTWSVEGNSVKLKYLTINDRTIAEITAETKEMAERGAQAGLMNEMILENIKEMAEKQSQVWLSDDKKRLMFSDPAAARGKITIGLISGLERLVPEKSA